MLRRITARIKKASADAETDASAKLEVFFDFSTLDSNELMREYEKLNRMVTAARIYNNGEYACRYCEKIKEDISHEMRRRLSISNK